MGHFGCHCPIAQWHCCDEFGHFAQDCPTRFLPQEHHATKTDLLQGIDIPRGTDHTLPIMVPDMEILSADHNPTAISIMTGAAF